MGLGTAGTNKNGLARPTNLKSKHLGVELPQGVLHIWEDNVKIFSQRLWIGGLGLSKTVATAATVAKTFYSSMHIHVMIKST